MSETERIDEIKRRDRETEESVTSVRREESGERRDSDHSLFVPRGVELLDLPSVDVGVIVPRLRLVVLSLVLLLPRQVRASIVVVFHSQPAKRKGFSILGF